MFIADIQIFDIKETFLTDEGYLDVPATIAKAGIQEYSTDEPFMKSQLEQLPEEYRKPGTIIRVLRSEDEVFKDEALNSFKNKPVTNDHPHFGLVTVDNVGNVQIGFSDSVVQRKEDMVKTKLTIWNKQAIEDVEKGKQQVSAGYTSELVWVSGNDPDYGPYDAKFTNIIGNHIALVDRGRAGPKVKLFDRKPNNQGESVKMAERTINNVKIEISDDKVGVIDALLEDSKNKDKQLGEKETIIADKDKEIEKLKGEKSTLEAKINDEAAIDKLVSERVEMVEHGKKYVKDFDPTGKSNHEIRVEVLKRNMDKLDLEGKSEEFVTAAFDTFVAMGTPKEKADKSIQGVQDALGKTNSNDGKTESWLDRRNKFIEDSKNAYKGGE